MPRDAGRNSQALRYLEIISFLASRHYGVTLDELADQFGVQTRTIRRDFEAIEAFGYQVQRRTIDGRVLHRLDNPLGTRIPAAHLTIDELTALLLAHDSARADLPYGSHLGAAMTKIEQALPPALRDFMLTARSALSAHLAPPVTVSTAVQARYLQQLIAATRDHRRLEIGYDAAYAGTSKQYRLEPYRLVASNGAFYLCAWVTPAMHWRVFAVHRIERLTALDDRFEPTRPLAADPFGHSLGPFIGEAAHVELIFDATTARYITERRWHSSQRALPLPGGRLQLSLEVCIDYSLRSWILGFGRTVDVRAPRALADWHRAEALAMLRHESPPADALVVNQAPARDDATKRPIDAPPAPRDQRALPFSSEWYPAPPFIVADAHEGGASDAYNAYLSSVLGEAGASDRPARRTVTTRSQARKR